MLSIDAPSTSPAGQSGGTLRFPDPRRSYAPPLHSPADTFMSSSGTSVANDGTQPDGTPEPPNKPLTGISTEDLRLELGRRQKRLSGLYIQRDRLARQLADVNAQIASLGGGAAP